jgi:hypothetical protein
MGRLRRSDRPTRDDGVTGRRDDGVTGRVSRIRSHPVTPSPSHPVRTAAGLVPFTFGVLILAGCGGLNQTMGIDPLLGGPPLRPATAAAPIPSAPAPLPVLPLPPTNSSLSTAALAAGAPRPLDNGQDLRIGSPIGSAGNDGWARQGSGSSNQDSQIRRMADSSGAILQPPQPIAEPPPKRDSVPVSNPGSLRGSSATVTTFEQAERELKTRGVLLQRLQAVGQNGEWTCRCSMPNPQNPRIHRTYEAQASDPVAAIRAVLEQIDKEQ